MEYILTVIFNLAVLPPLIAASQCHFPDNWHGTWFQNSLGDVIIKEHVFGDKGQCQEQHNDYFIINRKSESGEKCSICMLIIQRHDNIIQYRESFCLNGNLKADDCPRRLHIENPLHTLVRENAKPVPCPFTDAYNFKYKNNTRTFCDKPKSYVKPCASNSKYHFHFRHCRNQYETHEKEVEFQCLATWKDGEDYLYGGFIGVSNDNMYRCFIYEGVGNPPTDISIAMSADASCQGLSSPEDGPVVMAFSRDSGGWETERCNLPEWLRHKDWRDLSAHHMYTADSSGKIWNIHYRHRRKGSGHVSSALRCNRIIQDDGSMFVAVSFTSNDCDSYYQCIRVRRIKDNVIEYSKSPPSLYPIDMCETDQGYEERQILFHEDATHTDCPFPGRFEPIGVVTDIDITSCSSKITSGCNGTHVMQIQSQCVERTDTHKLECISEWQDGGKHYVIARKPLPKSKSEDITKDQQSSLANCFTFAYEGANLRIETDHECNTDTEHLLGGELEALVEGHPSPCQKQPSKEVAYTSSNSGQSTHRLTWHTTNHLLTLVGLYLVMVI